MPKVHNAEYIAPGNYSKYDFGGDKRKPTSQTRTKRNVNLGFLGKAAPYIRALKDSGVGDMGIIWVPVIIGGIKWLAILGTTGYFGHKLLSKPGEAFTETLKKTGEHTKMAAPFIAGAVGTALMHKYAIPERYKKFSAVIPAGLAAFSVYKLLVEKTPTQIAKTTAAKYLADPNKKPLLIPGTRLAGLAKGFFARAIIRYDPIKGYVLDIITNNTSSMPKKYIMKMYGAEVANGKAGEVKEWMDAEPGHIPPLTEKDKTEGILLISAGMTGEMITKSIEGLEKKYEDRYVMKVFFYGKDLTKPFYVTSRLNYRAPVRKKKASWGIKL